MRSTFRALSLAAGFAIAGCASSTSPGDGASDAATDNATSDARADVGFDAGDAMIDSGTETSVDVPSPTDAVETDASFACGPMSCDPATQYCQVITGARLPDGGVDATYRCDPWAFVCDTDHTCTCLQHNLKCATTCTTDAAGNVTLVCGVL